MKIVFVTNFYNHHQKPLADAFYSRIGDDYCFIETKPISEERLKMGWGFDERSPYILQSYIDDVSKNKCQQIINDADVVIYGSAPYSMIENRVKAGKLTFKYCERPYKNGVPILKLPIHILRAQKMYARFKNFYMLCASAYAPLDFSKKLAFIGKTYKWGYFTELKKYDDIDRLISDKTPLSISWVARFISLKHPELPVTIVKRLKDEGYNVKLSMIGNGELEDSIKCLINDLNVEDCVEMLGAMRPEQVREHMEKSEIFLFTSDKNEGWGAVLNEAMNSACAVVANSNIGSVPFLVTNGENGYMYRNGDIDDIYDKVKLLIDNADERRRISKNAYITMKNEWNAENAADKFISISEKMLQGEYKPFPYDSGVCSKAEIIKDNWFK